MLTAGPSLIICRQQLRRQPELDVVRGWSGANGAACKPTPALHLRRGVFQVEHFLLVSALMHQPGKPLPRCGNSMLAFDELCLRSPEQGIDPAARAAGLGLYETRSCDGDTS